VAGFKGKKGHSLMALEGSNRDHQSEVGREKKKGIDYISAYRKFSRNIGRWND